MIDKYTIINVTANGMLVEYTDSQAAVSQCLNLLLPLDDAGDALTGDALTNHILSPAPVDQIAAAVKAKQIVADLPVGTPVAITEQELSTAKGI